MSPDGLEPNQPLFNGQNRNKNSACCLILFFFTVCVDHGPDLEEEPPRPGVPVPDVSLGGGQERGHLARDLHPPRGGRSPLFLPGVSSPVRDSSRVEEAHESGQPPS